MSLSAAGVWQVGVWDQTVWADGVWREGEPPIVESTQTAAGRLKRQRYVVEIDNRVFEVSSFAEAHALLERAKALAVTAAEKQVQRAVKRARRRGRVIEELTLKLPEIETQSLDLGPLIHETQQAIRSVYERIARDAEIRELMRVKLTEEDEEDAIITLLLH